MLRTSLVVQWLRLCAPNAGGPGLIPHAAAKKDPECCNEDQRSHVPQLRPSAAKQTYKYTKNLLKIQ